MQLRDGLLTEDDIAPLRVGVLTEEDIAPLSDDAKALVRKFAELL